MQGLQLCTHLVVPTWQYLEYGEFGLGLDCGAVICPYYSLIAAAIYVRSALTIVFVISGGHLAVTYGSQDHMRSNSTTPKGSIQAQTQPELHNIPFI